MSEQEVVEEPVEASVEPAEGAEEPSKAEGTQYVELDEANQRRFNRIYGNMKEYERQNRQLIQDQQTIIARLEKAESAQVQSATEQRFEGLNTKKEAALEAGDIDRVRDVDREITDAVKELTTPTEPGPQPEPVAEERLSPELESQIQAWANESGEDGNFVRPWAQVTHPMNSRAIPIAQSVLDDPEYSGAAAPDIFKEIEKRVNAGLFPKKQVTQAVLSSDGGNPSPGPEGSTRLSADQKEAARKVYPKLNAKDAEARYAAAVKEHG